MYTVDKNTTATKIRLSAKAEYVEKLLEILRGEYGEENVAMVRTGNTTKVNEIAVLADTVVENGVEKQLVFTVNPVVRPWNDVSNKRGTTPAFDFEKAKQAYIDYVSEKEQEKIDKEKQKAEKIQRDKEERERRKAEKEAEKNKASE